MAKREPTVGRHQLDMDGEWGLLELSGFGRQYVQVYSMMYALHFGAEEEEPEERTGARVWRLSVDGRLERCRLLRFAANRRTGGPPATDRGNGVCVTRLH